jgi:hypothetical protein
VASVSKSGLDKSLRKNGAGPHNWGSLEEQTHPYIHHNLDNAKLPPQNQNFKGEEEDIDLGNDDDEQGDQLATSPSAAAAINVDDGAEQAEKNVPNGGMQRRMSNMTDEEREKAKAWRHGAMNRDSSKHLLTLIQDGPSNSDQGFQSSRLGLYRSNLRRIQSVPSERQHNA